MREYEIRILKTGNVLALAMSGSYQSDFSAIRTAQTLRNDGQMAEVWRDEECIYQDNMTANAVNSMPAA